MDLITNLYGFLSNGFRVPWYGMISIFSIAFPFITVLKNRKKISGISLKKFSLFIIVSFVIQLFDYSLNLLNIVHPWIFRLFPLVRYYFFIEMLLSYEIDKREKYTGLFYGIGFLLVYLFLFENTWNEFPVVALAVEAFIYLALGLKTIINQRTTLFYVDRGRDLILLSIFLYGATMFPVLMKFNELKEYFFMVYSVFNILLNLLMMWGFTWES